jgi:hypothetical protein
MKWPRGKYNGRRIVGFEIIIAIDVTNWRSLFFNKVCSGLLVMAMGPIRITLSLNYE